jgi:hypothetical protein
VNLQGGERFKHPDIPTIVAARNAKFEEWRCVGTSNFNTVEYGSAASAFSTVVSSSGLERYRTPPAVFRDYQTAR